MELKGKKIAFLGDSITEMPSGPEERYVHHFENLSGAITGGANDSFYGKNEGRTKEAILRKVTKYLLIAFFILTIAVNAVPQFFA